MSEILIEKLKSGDKAALGEVYKLYREQFLQFAKRYHKDEELLEDIYQDVSIALFDRAVSGKLELEKSSIKTYLFSMGKFMLFTKLKKERPSVEFSQDQEWNQGMYEEAKLFIEEPDSRVAFLGKSLAKLGEKCKKILELYYYENKSMKEIQLLLDYNHPDVVKSHKSRCMKTLKESFKHKKFEY
ncbi:sigma-70 family RNA polymerase sigma factor [Algoriphagus sp. AGSA1]|uniref:RNA polymerase sigma factor n=1 Tax=Algoriphagus sp. AGSA1 TaxID=2907213 RepID=UPI001F28919B|nr:sigma-70 family RNA polymerase sigma factor [Algoriphagus sp. AGSA1]MCE7056442.1 sigma-70 family RNA polymerase sigma factor [Algoriphagus sp. AGSA1]